MIFGRGRAAAAAERSPASFEEADEELAQVLDNLAAAVNYADWIVALAAPYLGPQILELGAGHGTLTGRLARHGKVTATELSPRCVETLTQRYAGSPDIEILHGDIEAAVDARTYDSAVLVNVLEHIPDDVGALRTLHNALRPGGTLVLFVPAFEALYSEFDRMVGHYRRYRRPDLMGRVRGAGFDVVDARYVNVLGGLAWWVIARQLGRFPSNVRTVRTYDRVVTPVVRRLETRFVPPFGQSLLCVGRRPATAGDV
ncbi:MAG: methyltransferase domain-containing protein [Actinomycetota bacterium]|nr:methyltransferase domain-containing protein [Actinomycetota bacterium]